MSESRTTRLEPGSSSTGDQPRTDAVAARITSKRRQLGWSFARLAKAAQLQSPAYVFHIENGHKVPTEAVAIRIARALDLDEELLAAWSRARGRTHLEGAIAAARTLERLLGEHASQPSRVEPAPTRDAGLVPAPANAPAQATSSPSAQTISGEEAWADLLIVPLLPEGFDPSGVADAALPVLERLRLDRRLFPPLASIARPVAYRLGAHAVRGIAGLLSPGDCVVVSRDGEPPVLDALTAVRRGGRVEIVRWSPRHLPAIAGAPDSHAPPEPDVSAGIVGRVVVAFRRWL